MKAGGELLGMTIVSDDGRRMGTVSDLLFDERCRRVVGLVLQSGYLFRTREVVGFSQVRSIGAHEITLAESPAHLPTADDVAELTTDQRSLQGKPVVTREGRYVGAVSDVLFDEANGRVLGFEVAHADAGGRRQRREELPNDLTTLVADAVLPPPAA